MNAAIYWDTSAIISTLFQDAHTEAAQRAKKRKAFHILSSLAIAETLAIISRIERGLMSTLPTFSASAAREALERGPWHYLDQVPDREILQDLAQRCSLRGADLWHLACAKTLTIDVPELELITFDHHLSVAAQSVLAK